MVRHELERLDAQRQDEFLQEYRRKRKSVGAAYLLWLFLGWHYAYLGKWGVQVLFWLTVGGVGVWWLIDLFRVPGMVADTNKDRATAVLVNLKAISS